MQQGPKKHSRDDADSDISSQDSEQKGKKKRASAIDERLVENDSVEECSLKAFENKRPPEIVIDDMAAKTQVKKTALLITYEQFLDACRTGDLVKLELGLCSLNRLLEIAVARDNEALRLAAQSGHLAVVNRLLEIDLMRENAAASNNEALQWSAQRGHLAVVNRLLEIDSVCANAAADDNFALRFAAQRGYLAVVNRLLVIDSVRGNAAAVDNFALQLAAENGHLAVLNRLLEIDSVRANATADDNYALGCAAENGHLTVVNRLLEMEEVKINVDADSNAAFKKSVSNKHYPVAIRLFKEPATRQYMIDNQMEFFTSAFEEARQQYAKAKRTAVLVLNQTPLTASLRKMILQAAFHDTECGKSSCLTAAPSTITNAVSFCQMFNPKASMAQPLVELVQPQPQLKKSNGSRP